MNVFNVVNSFIGKKGNIGFRTSKIFDFLNQQNINHYSFSRGLDPSVSVLNKKHLHMGIFGHVPRILNAYRIYWHTSFNHRFFDIKLFDFFFLKALKSFSLDEPCLFHLWEISPKIIATLKKKRYKVILDLPIAPSLTNKRLLKEYGKDRELSFFDSICKMELDSFKMASHVIVPSSFVKKELLKAGLPNHKITMVPFGADTTTNNKKLVLSKKETLHYCFAGNLNKRKGVDLLLKAWEDPIFFHDKLHLCGRLYPEIKKILQRKNIKNIILPGFISTKEYFKKCDVYVFPSFLEGSSKSVYEAMREGLACIVTENSGSIIKDGYDGLMVRVGDMNDLRDKMKVVKENYHVRKKISQNAFESIKKYSWQRYAENVFSVYQKVG